MLDDSIFDSTQWGDFDDIAEEASFKPGPFHGCSMEGDARSPGFIALDRLKNRFTAPSPADIDLAITLGAIPAAGNGISRWKVKEGAEIVGYVSDVKRGGIEAYELSR